ncbi:DUF4912 domain-containing protein [Archangium primigenium]|uniref:DUF4912 domain-containing protein n=1 Tax=[Archangium] primigenium TaxID=2792470 RepID=UPI00195641BF|nr:DUF4912 domain-containing protein [Archangium primigenium]MBM7115326.1 DUF4912 domain-containing protein [Archangium primigenium]
MGDLKSVMVEHLRQLAHARLERMRGRPGLVGVLVEGVSRLARRLGLRPARSSPLRAAPSDKPEDKDAPLAPRGPLPGDDEEKTPVYIPPPRVRVVNFPPKPKSKPQRPSPDEEATLFSPGDEDAEAVAPVATEAEPLVEGFFVARIAGEQEAARHHLGRPGTPPPPGPGHPEGPGGLPREYGDDTVLLLPRDPHTLYVVWDFSAASRRRAMEGLESPSAVLRLFNDQDRLLSVIDIALESRGYYLHGLPAGQPYRVEVHFLGRKGATRRIGPSSNRVMLPPGGPSADTSVRFMRVPSRLSSRDEASRGPSLRTLPADASRPYITWRRVSLPGSERTQAVAGAPRAEGASEVRAVGSIPGQGTWFGSSGPVGGASEQVPGGAVSSSLSSSFSSSFSSWGPLGGASEQVPGGPGVPGVQRGEGAWLASAGPVGGSSEQVPGGAGGRSEAGHWFWSAGPVGGSSEQVPGAEAGPWFGSTGPVGSSEPRRDAGAGGLTGGAWVGSAGPVGSSEQAPGHGGGVARGEARWVWWYGPVGSAPEGFSGHWVVSHGPSGSSELGSSGRPDLPSSPVR